MESLFLETTEENSFTTPEVNFDCQTGVCVMSGEAFMNNSYEFFRPLIKWLEEFTTRISKQLRFIFKLTYYNTSSSKSLFEMLEVMKTFEDKGGDLIIEWHYDKNDTEMMEDITDLALSSEVNITLVPY